MRNGQIVRYAGQDCLITVKGHKVTLCATTDPKGACLAMDKTAGQIAAMLAKGGVQPADFR